MRLLERSLGSTSFALFPPEPKQGVLVIAHYDPDIRAANESAPNCQIGGCFDTHFLALQLVFISTMLASGLAMIRYLNQFTALFLAG